MNFLKVASNMFSFKFLVCKVHRNHSNFLITVFLVLRRYNQELKLTSSVLEQRWYTIKRNQYTLGLQVQIFWFRYIPCNIVVDSGQSVDRLEYLEPEIKLPITITITITVSTG